MERDSQRVVGVVWLFLGVWIVGCVAGIWLFYGDRDVAFKRRWSPPFLIGGGVMVVLFMLAAGFPVHVVVFLVPALALITALNVWTTVFCSACGGPQSRYTAAAGPARYCSRCGADLELDLWDGPGELLRPEQAAAARPRAAAEAAAKSAPAAPPDETA